MESHQLDLFSDNTISSTSRSKAKKLLMSKDALERWKSLIVVYQQQVRETKSAQQTTLFDLAPTHTDPDNIDPFSLRLHPFQFYRSPDQGDKVCLYFIIDNNLPLLLYVGETKRTPKERWVVHDCQEYAQQYIQLHRKYNLDVAVATAFWWDTPSDRKARQKLERELILKWRSPFNKENWELWGQPFGKFSH